VAVIPVATPQTVLDGPTNSGVKGSPAMMLSVRSLVAGSSGARTMVLFDVGSQIRHVDVLVDDKVVKSVDAGRDLFGLTDRIMRDRIDRLWSHGIRPAPEYDECAVFAIMLYYTAIQCRPICR
jgi:hypothetical protein